MIMRGQPSNAQDAQRKIVSISLLGAPGSILVGLGLYGIFAGGNAFWEPLDNTFVTYNMLGIGAMIMAWETVQIIRVVKRQRAGIDRKP
jgi:hypothetical protein